MMTILYALVVICMAATTAVVPAVNCQYYSETTSPGPTTTKKATITFYLHDTLTGNDPTTVKVAQSPTVPTTANNPVPWSSLFVIDDPITEGPNLSSPVLGNAQGMYVSSGKSDLSLVLYMEFGFTTGKFSGSTFSIFSRNPVASPVREVAVVGGTGLFRFARGFALIRTQAINFTTADGVFEYTTTLYY